MTLRTNVKRKKKKEGEGEEGEEEEEEEDDEEEDSITNFGRLYLCKAIDISYISSS